MSKPQHNTNNQKLDSTQLYNSIPTVSLEEFTVSKYIPVYEKYRTAGLKVYMDLVDLHWLVTREVELQKYEQVNKRIFRNIQAFRAYLDEEIIGFGDPDELLKKRNIAIQRNKTFRDHAALTGHHYINQEKYMFHAEDDRDQMLDLASKEWDLCRGIVLEDRAGGCQATWKIIPIPEFVGATRFKVTGLASFAQEQVKIETEEEVRIEVEQANKYVKDLISYLASEDRVRQGYAELLVKMDVLKNEGAWLTHNFAQFFNNTRTPVEINAKKEELLGLRKMRLQCERLDKENKEFIKAQAEVVN